MQKLSIKSLIYSTSLLLFVFAALLTFFVLRPNSSKPVPNFIQDISQLPSTDRHNAFTDLIWFKDHYYLSYRSAPSHIGKDNVRIVLLRSKDSKDWQLTREFQIPGKDVRDPKLAAIGGKLFIYFLSASELDDQTTTTFFSHSTEGHGWTEVSPLKPSLKRIWRPKSFDQKTWYAPIFRDEKVDLYKTTNGIDWSFVSNIYSGAGADETAIAFLEDARLIASVREQNPAYQGDNSRGTHILEARPPYQEWKPRARAKNRLDGPLLFSHKNKVYAIGRRQIERDSLLFQMGSGLARKRTSLFELGNDGWKHRSDFPSSGDTSYAAISLEGEDPLVSYYTNEPNRDLPWFLGMFAPTQVVLARIRL